MARCRVVAVWATFVLLVSLAGAARAYDRVYWTNDLQHKISDANLDGSGGGDLDTAGATVRNPVGLVLDPAAGRIYWANVSANKISWAALNGFYGGDLNTGGATIRTPFGLALDGAGRIYWTNANANKISFANLNGTGGGDLNTGNATVSGPEGVAVDPARGAIYWANHYANKISWSSLSGYPSGDLNTGNATVNEPEGVALDGAGHIYWANHNGKISVARLDCNCGGDLNTTGATPGPADAVALDTDAGVIYWTNPGGKISFARLDSTGGGDVKTTGATSSNPTFLALLQLPRVVYRPTVSLINASPTTLFCAVGQWAPDLPSAFLFRAPTGRGYQWTVGDGVDIPGATSSVFRPTTPGSYRCNDVARNAAGSVSAGSAPFTVATITKPRIDKVKVNGARRTATFSFKSAPGARFQCALVAENGAHTPKAKFEACRSPKTYQHLRSGRYIFEVRASNSVGTGPIAKRAFKI